MASSLPKPAFSKGSVLGHREREIIYNVHSYFLQEKDSKKPLHSLEHVLARTAHATKISKRTIARIIDNGADFSTPGKSSKRGRKETPIDDFDRCIIRRLVHSFFREKKLPTLQNIIAELEKQQPDIVLKKDKLRKTLVSMGFVYRRRRSKIDYLKETAEICAWRGSYLRQVQEIKKNYPEKPFIYLDETWLNEGYTRERTWEDTTTLRNPYYALKSGLTVGTIYKPNNLGRRLMIVHAGSQDGFVPLDLEKCIFEGKVNVDGDYHKNMNCSVFESWFRHLLCNIKKPSVIIMDNASYHSRKTEDYPTSTWLKSQYQSWLSSKGVKWTPDMLKVELWQLCKQHRVLHRVYVCDEMASEHGHIVLRLPPYHSDLNPIELIWAQVKDYVGARNTRNTLKDIRTKLQEAFSVVSPARWRACCKHVEEIQDEYRKSDLAFDLTVPDVCFDVESESDISATESESEGVSEERNDPISDEDIIDFSSL